MKTAISLPDPLFAAADKYAAEHGMSRSALFANALREYLDKHMYDSLTEAIDAAVEECDDAYDKEVLDAGKKQLRDLEW